MGPAGTGDIAAQRGAEARRLGDRPRPRAEGTAGAAQPPGAEPTRILVVDDNAIVAAALADMLRLDGHEVDIAGDGAAALETLGRAAYDAIVSDMHMPVLDGPGLYRELERRYPALAGRFVACSGDLVSPWIRTFLDQTGVPFMDKPFTLEQVRRIVARVAAPCICSGSGGGAGGAGGGG